MRKIIFILISALILGIAAYFAFVYYVPFSEGYRSGELIKFSRKGVIAKTWEGEISQGISGAQIFEFSVQDSEEDVIEQLIKLQGKYVKVTYKESEGFKDDIERFGFLIEHPRELADRMNGRILGETYGVSKNIHLPAYKTFTVFQYMIGNTDWGLANRHNVKLVHAQHGDMKLPVPVPYDFDFCCLVNAPYAIPHYSHPINDVKERYFQWRGGETDFSDVFNLFEEKKESMIGLVADCPHLVDSVKTDALTYLNSFFDMLETPDKITNGNVAVKSN